MIGSLAKVDHDADVGTYDSHKVIENWGKSKGHGAFAKSKRVMSIPYTKF